MIRGQSKPQQITIQEAKEDCKSKVYVSRDRFRFNGFILELLSMNSSELWYIVLAFLYGK